jgi:hypothetical protein
VISAIQCGRVGGSAWRAVAALLVLPALILLFFHRMAFSNLILARGDTFLYFYPYWAMASAALRDGRIPLWNPHIFMGVPFLANSQAGFFYPLNWPLWLLLPVPYAASATILLHLTIAGWGTMLAGRRLLALEWPAALLSGVAFALGGYLTAQIEHLNQLQGLAWLPWFFVALAPLANSGALPGSVFSRTTIAVAGLFALQLLAGHTQTAFISGVAVVSWLLVVSVRQRDSLRLARRAITLLLAAGTLSLLLAAMQLSPTLELTQLSSRQGGLPENEVLSFSWHPLHLARAMLPLYGQSLFTEYVTFLPLAILILALIGAWRWRTQPAIAAFLLLAIIALVLAFGRFTPVYWLLARLPGFNLFRVPARWLILYAFSAALLSGAGWQTIRLALGGQDESRQVTKRAVRLAVFLLAGLIAWSVAGRWLAGIILTGAEAPYESPSALTLAGWTIELLFVMASIWATVYAAGYSPLLSTPLPVRARQTGRAAHGTFPILCRSPLSYRLPPVVLNATGYGLLLLSGVVLFIASRALPYNHLTTPEAYFDWRPAPARLAAVSDCAVPAVACLDPTARFLSLSDTFFDPGDLSEINALYAGQLDAASLYTYIVAIKEKEIIVPNLSMVFGLEAVDGFDGGVLPLRTYSQLMQLILPEEMTTADGRLREHLDAVPEARWLDLFNARFVITDKVGDAWYEGVYFDRQNPVSPIEEPVIIGHMPRFEATELWVLVEGEPGEIVVETTAGREWKITGELLQPGLYRYAWPEPALAQQIRILPCAESGCSVTGLTLVDHRDNTFHSLVAGNYRLIHSGDVKIYENLDVLSRAFIVYDWRWTAGLAESVALMKPQTFDPRYEATLVGNGPLPAAVEGSGTAEILTYEPERVVLQVESNMPGLLLLTDSFYPGWEATVDGAPATIYAADALFRGVFIPAGTHEVAFVYRPYWFYLGPALSIIGFLLCVVLMASFRSTSKMAADPSRLVR